MRSTGPIGFEVGDHQTLSVDGRAMEAGIGLWHVAELSSGLADYMYATPEGSFMARLQDSFTSLDCTVHCSSP